MNTGIYSCHANMCFVDFNSVMLIWSGMLEDISLFSRWPPELAIEEISMKILNNSFAPNWDFILPLVVCVQHMGFNFRAVWDRWFPFFVKR